MSWLHKLAVSASRRLYRHPVVGDVPRNKWLFAVCHGTQHKLANYRRLRADYRRGRDRVSGYPCQLRVDPTSVCNLRCPLCPTGAGEVDRGVGSMSLATFSRVLDRFAEYAFMVHLWVWGEPLLHRGVADMVAMATARNVGTEISTHFSRQLSDDDLDRLILAGLTWLIVSADGATASTYEKYRIGGDFDLVTSNVRRLIERRRLLRSPTPFVEWQFVPFQHNEHETADVVTLARRLGVDGLRFKPARLDKPGGMTFGGRVTDTRTKWAPSQEPWRRLHDLSAPAFLAGHCPSLWKSITIHPNGAISPCCEVYLTKDEWGHVDDDFDDLWNGTTYRTARRVALGLDHGPQHAHLACHGCRVFRKPFLNGSNRDTRAETQAGHESAAQYPTNAPSPRGSATDGGERLADRRWALQGD